MIFGYNGFGRLLGGRGGGPGGGTPPSGGIGGTTTLQTAGSTTQTIADGAGMMPGGMGGGSGGGHGPGGTGFGGQTGIFRIFNNDFGPNIAWLLVLALAGGGLMLWILRKTPRTNRGRAAVIFLAPNNQYPSQKILQRNYRLLSYHILITNRKDDHA